MRFSKDGGQDAAFEVDRPALGMSVNIIGQKQRKEQVAFVEPKMLP